MDKRSKFVYRFQRCRLSWVMRVLFSLFVLVQIQCGFAAPQLERLNRGFVAIQTPTNTFLSWRLLASDPTNLASNIFADGRKLNSAPLVNATCFVVTNANTGNFELRSDGQSARPLSFTNYLSIPLRLPAGYTPNDGSVGDLDGDGQYEIILKSEQRPRDTASLGLTGQTILQ